MIVFAQVALDALIVFVVAFVPFVFLIVMEEDTREDEVPWKTIGTLFVAALLAAAVALVSGAIYGFHAVSSL